MQYIYNISVVFIDSPRLYNMFKDNTAGMTHLKNEDFVCVVVVKLVIIFQRRLRDPDKCKRHFDSDI
jgi:hypothetical protein